MECVHMCTWIAFMTMEERSEYFSSPRATGEERHQNLVSGYMWATTHEVSQSRKRQCSVTTLTLHVNDNRGYGSRTSVQNVKDLLKTMMKTDCSLLEIKECIKDSPLPTPSGLETDQTNDLDKPGTRTQQSISSTHCSLPLTPGWGTLFPTYTDLGWVYGRWWDGRKG